jgi:hypothetical protein
MITEASAALGHTQHKHNQCVKHKAQTHTQCEAQLLAAAAAAVASGAETYVLLVSLAVSSCTATTPAGSEPQPKWVAHHGQSSGSSISLTVQVHTTTGLLSH